MYIYSIETLYKYVLQYIKVHLNWSIICLRVQDKILFIILFYVIEEGFEENGNILYIYSDLWKTMYYIIQELLLEYIIQELSTTD